MHFILAFTVLALSLSPRTLALFFNHPFHQARQVNPPQPSLPSTAGISTRITSRNGTDISSSFQTLFYHSHVADAHSNLTNRDLTDLGNNNSLIERQTGPAGARPIDSCRRRNALFVSSECDYRASLPRSMQRYKVRCRFATPRGGWTYRAEAGHCNPNEICVNPPPPIPLPSSQTRPASYPPEPSSSSSPPLSIASCISQAKFKPLPQPSASNDPASTSTSTNPNINAGEAGQEAVADPEIIDSQLRLAQFLADAKDVTVSAIVSHADRTTGWDVEALEIDTGRNSSSSAAAAAGIDTGSSGSSSSNAGPGTSTSSSKKGGQKVLESQTLCRSCMEVGTGMLARGTEYVGAEVTVDMVTAAGAGAGMAGVLWLVALAG